MPSAGWQFWIDDNGRIRMFTLAIADFPEAERTALSVSEGGQVISYSSAPTEVITHLNLEPGGWIEWASLNPQQPIVPSGTMRAGRADATRA